MALKAKLDLLNLTEEERVKAQTKFLATLSLVTEEELKEELDFLKSKGVNIAKAKEIKVLADSVTTIGKKFSILGEIHEEGLYVQEPTQITKNAIDIYKKIQYCKQAGRPYKKEDGTYEHFLFNEQAWQKEFNKENDLDIAMDQVEEDVITLEPGFEPVMDNVVSFEDFITPEEPIQSNEVESDFEKTIQFENLNLEPVVEHEELEDTKHIDINVYNAAAREMKQIDEKTTDFATVRKELENQLAELDSLKSIGMEEEISFSDLEPETYGMRRAA